MLKRLRFSLLLLAALTLTPVRGFAGTPTTDTYSVPGIYTWTCPAGVTSATIEAWAGGGTGGGKANSEPIAGAAGGGGGGEYSKKVVTVVPGVSYPVVVGAGGVALRPAAARGRSRRRQSLPLHRPAQRVRSGADTGA